jgi:nitric oxide reductase subunit C
MQTQSEAGPGWRRPLLLALGVLVALLVCAALAGAAIYIYQAATAQPGSLGGPPAEVTPVEFASLPAGAAADGQQLFSEGPCSACHSLIPDQKIVGPSLAGVGTRAPGRKPDYTAEEYLLESIINPNAYIVKGFSRNIMPGTFQSQFSDQDLADLVAFLLTQ